MIRQTILSYGSIRALCAAGLALAATFPAAAQASRWADDHDPTAKEMIALEHQWTDADCTHSTIVETLLADDFQGTSPEGLLYSKQDALTGEKDLKELAHACETYEVKVHFFGKSPAILYGSESAVRKGTDGKDHPRKMIWTDTWLKRNGKWQIVAAQDMPMAPKCR